MDSMDGSPSNTEDVPTRERLRRLFGRKKRSAALSSQAPGLRRFPVARSQDVALGVQSKLALPSTADAQTHSVGASLSEPFPGPSKAGPSTSAGQSHDTQHQAQASPSPQPTPPDNRASRLWDLAYDQIKVALPELVSRYEQVLSRYLSEEDISVSTEAEENINDVNSYRIGEPSQGRMNRVLKVWFAMQGTATPSEDNWKRFVLLAQGTWENIPQASLPLVAVCLGIQAAFESQASVARGIFTTIMFVFCRMGWYCRLSELLPRDHAPTGNNDKCSGLEQALVHLYRTALFYCIGAACYRGGHGEPDFANADALKADLLDKESALPASTGKRQIEVQLRQLIESVSAGAWPEPNEHVEVEAEAERTDDGNDTENLANIDQETLLPPLPQDNGSFERDINDWLDRRQEFSKFQDWNSGRSNCLLWISGAAGSGKTTIMTIIVRRLLREKNADSSDYKNVYFFPYGGSPNHGTLASVVGCLVKQIYQEQRNLEKYIDGKKDWNSQQGLNNLSNFPAMSEALYGMTRDDEFLPSYFVLDSVDECSGDNDSADAGTQTLDQLLALVSTITNESSKVRWLLSVNPEVVKNRVKDEDLHIDVDLDPSVLRPAAERHIYSCVRKLTHDSPQSSSFQSQVKREFLTKSSGNFLWVSLAFQIIQVHGTPWNIRRILNDLPQGVKELYKYALRTRHPWEDAYYSHRVLRVATMAHRSLHIMELQDIIPLPSELEPSLFIEKRCYAFLKVLDGMVSFLHESGRQFLKLIYNEVHATKSEIHATITMGCLGFLMGSLDHSNPKMLASHYAVIGWMEHFPKIWPLHNANKMVVYMVCEFLSQRFLPWIESLASTKYPLRVLVQLSNLERSLGAQWNPYDIDIKPCIDLVNDAVHVLQLQQASQIQPNLKVRNFLLFHPSKSGIGERYRLSEFPWLDSAPNIDRHLSPQLFALKGHSDWARSCEYSPDGRFIASSSDDCTIRIWDAQTGELQNILRNVDGWVYRVIYSSGFIAALEARSVTIWDSATHILRKKLVLSDLGEKYAGSVLLDMAASLDGTMLAVAAENIVAIWGIPSYESKVWNATSSAITGVIFSSDGSLLAVALTSSVTILKTKDLELTRSLNGGDHLRAPRFSPGSRYLAAGSAGNEFFVWDLNPENETPRKFSGHHDSVNTISFSPDRQRIVSGSNDGEIRVWDLESDEAKASVRVLKGHERGVLCVTFSPVSSRNLASTSKGGTVRLWDIDAEEVVAGEDNHSVRHPSPVNFVTLSPDGKTIASGCEEGRIYLWDGETGIYRQELKPLEAENHSPHNGEVLWLAFSPDSSILVSTASENNFLLWNAHSGTQIREVIGHRDWVRSAIFSPDGRQVASASDDGTVRLWDVSLNEGQDKDNRKPRPPYRGHSDYVYCLAFSPDGRYLASAGDDSRILVQDLRLTNNLEQGVVDKELGPSPPSRGLAFFPGGDKIVSSSVDCRLRIWDRKSGQCLHKINTKTKMYRSMQFYGTLTDYILTEAGAQLLYASPGQPLPLPSWCSYGMDTANDDESWITYEGHKLVFLPNKYRLNDRGVSVSFVRGYKAVIGCESGALLLFKFDKKERPDPLGKDNPLW